MALKRFSTDSTLAKRAVQIYLILIGCAHRRETLSYELLSTKMGFERAAGVLADRLGPLMRWCEQNQLPPLTAIVVGKTSGHPGDGLTTLDEDFATAQQRVFAYDWYGIFPPELDELN